MHVLGDRVDAAVERTVGRQAIFGDGIQFEANYLLTTQLTG